MIVTTIDKRFNISITDEELYDLARAINELEIIHRGRAIPFELGTILENFRDFAEEELNG